MKVYQLVYWNSNYSYDNIEMLKTKTVPEMKSRWIKQLYSPIEKVDLPVVEYCPTFVRTVYA